MFPAKALERAAWPCKPCGTVLAARRCTAAWPVACPEGSCRLQAVLRRSGAREQRRPDGPRARPAPAPRPPRACRARSARKRPLPEIVPVHYSGPGYGCFTNGTKCCTAATPGCPKCGANYVNPSQLYGCQVRGDRGEGSQAGARRPGPGRRRPRRARQRRSGAMHPPPASTRRAAARSRRRLGEPSRRLDPKETVLRLQYTIRSAGRAVGPQGAPGL